MEKNALKKVKYPYRKMSDVFLDAIKEPTEDFYIITGDGSSFLGRDPWVYVVLLSRCKRVKIFFTYYTQKTQKGVNDKKDLLKKIGVNQIKIINLAKGSIEKGLQAAAINEKRSTVWMKVDIKSEKEKTEVLAGGITYNHTEYVGKPLKFPWTIILKYKLRIKSKRLKMAYEKYLIKELMHEYLIPCDKICLLPETLDKEYFEITKSEVGSSSDKQRLCKICPYILSFDDDKKRFFYKVPVVKEYVNQDLVKLIFGYFNLQERGG